MAVAACASCVAQGGIREVHGIRCERVVKVAHHTVLLIANAPVFTRFTCCLIKISWLIWYAWHLEWLRNNRALLCASLEAIFVLSTFEWRADVPELAAFTRLSQVTTLWSGWCVIIQMIVLCLLTAVLLGRDQLADRHLCGAEELSTNMVFTS